MIITAKGVGIMADNNNEKYELELSDLEAFARQYPDPNSRMEALKEAAMPFYELFTYYECAIDEVVTKFNILNKEYSLNNEQNPIESIQSRVKSMESLVDKINRKNIPFTIDSVVNNINDIAGVRVVCKFPEDVYKVRDGLLLQDDIHLLEEKDYIRHPKPNGYRSLHLIVETPIFLSTGKKLMKVEIQIRTIAENFWAALEHQLNYKKELPEIASIKEELNKLAEESANLDNRMEILKHKIMKLNGDE